MIIGISGLAGSGKDTCADFLVRNHGFTKVSFADPMKRIVRDVYGFSIDQLWGPSESRNAPDERYPREHGPFRSISPEAPVHDSNICPCCSQTFGVELSLGLGDQRRHPCFLTPRFALQQLGSEWGRACYPNTWVDYALTVATNLSAEGGCNYSAVRGLSHDWRPGDENWKTDVVIPDVRFKNEIKGLEAVGAILVRVVRPNAGLKGAAGAHGSETEQSAIPDSRFNEVIVNDGTLQSLREIVDDVVRKWKGHK